MDKERRAYAAAIAAALTTLTGDNWSLRKPAYENEQPHIRREDGATFYLSERQYEKNISVGPDWPRDAKGDLHQPYFSSFNAAKSPHITFSPTKTAEQAAKTINNRFLPQYLPLFLEQKAQANASDNWRAARFDLANEVAPLVDGRVIEAPSGISVALGQRTSGIIEVQLGDNRHLVVKVAGDVDTLKAVLKAINYMKKDQ